MAGSDLTPAQAMRLAKSVADIYAEATAELVKVVARRINAGLVPSRTATAQLTELKLLRDAAERVVRRAQAAGGREAVRVVQEAYRGGLRPSAAGLTAVNQRSVAAVARATLHELDNIAQPMLRWADDVYRQVAAETLPLGVTGTLTRREVTARALDRYAAAGVTGFTDRSGAVWRIEAYAEMVTRTGTQRAHLSGTIDRLTEQGRDLVEVTTSPAGCPLCRPYEGHVYSLSGTSSEYPPLAEATGLFHPNCTHTITGFVPGLSRVKDGTPPEAAERYEHRQRTRELERRVRESHRRVAAARELGQTNVLDANRELLRRRLDALRRHQSRV